MLRITANTSAAGATKYFDEGLSKSDYYSEKNEIVGNWSGKAAKLLELSGQVSKDEFEKLCYNIHPQTDEQLTGRNNPDRRVGYDFTFSVPKSVSIVYSQNQDEAILKAFQDAVDQTMQDLEQSAEARVRKGGRHENRVTENLVWGTFIHQESRPVGGIPDPHLHAHCFTFNATFDEKEKQWKAADFGAIKTNAPFYEAVFDSRLAQNLQKAGYEIERNGRDFEIAGFSRSTIEKFSNRTREIEEKAKELGITYAEDKAALGAKTRAGKRTGYDKEDIRLQWRSRLSEGELELIANAKKDGGDAVEKKNKGQEISPKASLEYALNHSLERKSTVSDKELLITSLKRGMGSVTVEDLQQELKTYPDLLSKKQGDGNIIYTTKEALGEEKTLKETARKGRGVFEPVNPNYQPKNEQLSLEQKDAVMHALKSKDFITVIVGSAGTGKTWSVKEIKEGVTATGKNFGAFAPSAAASRGVQREDGFSNATTIAELLQSKELQESVKNGVIWVDEAGMVGNKTMNRIIEVAKQQNARILLTGDTKQHGAVERGDALRVLQQFGGIKPAVISKIQRQKVEDYKKAVGVISEGRIEDGYSMLDKMGAIKESKDFNDLKEKVAAEYVQAIKNKEEVLIVATTHAQGKAVTGTIREQLQKQGKLGSDEKQFTVQKSLSFTDAQKTDAANYAEGMTIQFHQNVKSGFKRGEKYQVIGKDWRGNIWVGDEKDKKALPFKEANKFSVYQTEKLPLATGDQIRITQNGFDLQKKRLNNGAILSVKGFTEKGDIIASTGKNEVHLSKDYANLTHGYYTTSPASQGKSVNRVIVMQGAASGKASSKEQFYVSASRGKFAISIHTDDKENLLRGIQRSAHRVTATEIGMNRSEMTQRMKSFELYKVAISKVKSAMEKGKDMFQSIKNLNQQKYVRPVQIQPVRSK